MKWILILFSALILKSCGGFKASKSTEKNSLILTQLNTTYCINTLNGKNVSVYKLFISFNNNTKQVNGFSGCNRFFGTYNLEGNSLKFDSLGLTRKMCNNEANAIENEFNQALNNINSITQTANSIILLNNNNVLIKATKKDNNSDLIFKYSTSSRGNYKLIKIDNYGLLISNKRSANPDPKKINNTQWNTLLKLVETINLESLSTLKPPSKNHQFDGAALAHFKITKGDKTYEVAPFDHGKPHSVIEPLVKEMLSIAENIE